MGREILKAQPCDIHEIMELYGRARKFMREAGNPNQWDNGYPSESLIRSDIAQASLYILKDTETKEILGVAALTPGPDPTYKVICGAWLNDNPYGVIHRLAAKYPGANIASEIVDWAERSFDSIRIDTHRDNVPMQRFLKRHGYVYCGTISLPDGSLRLAYQKDMHHIPSAE